MMTEAKQIAELERKLEVADYERGFLQQRLDAIRKTKEQLVRLLDTPTLQEQMEADGPDFDIMKHAGRHR